MVTGIFHSIYLFSLYLIRKYSIEIKTLFHKGVLTKIDISKARHSYTNTQLNTYNTHTFYNKQLDYK